MTFRDDDLCTPQVARLPITMNARVDHLIDEALALPPEERSAVALALLDSLGGEDEAAVSQAWADEIRRRKQDLRSGTARAVAWEQAKARLSAL
jgi:putative addiction module component (TIGR02574 family)